MFSPAPGVPGGTSSPGLLAGAGSLTEGWRVGCDMARLRLIALSDSDLGAGGNVPISSSAVPMLRLGYLANDVFFILHQGILPLLKPKLLDSRSALIELTFEPNRATVTTALISFSPTHRFLISIAARAKHNGHFSWSTDRVFPAGSLNHAISGPRPREMPFASVFISPS